MKVFFNNKKDVFIDCLYDNVKNEYTAKILSDSKIFLGKMTFRIDINIQFNRVWLYNIEILENFRKKGYGTKLIEFLEFFAKQNKSFYIEGIYDPDTHNSKNFFIKNGYEIEEDDEDKKFYVFKDFENDKTPSKKITLFKNDPELEF